MTDSIRAMKGLLIDLDGTMYHGIHPIPDADRLILCLQQAELPYRFVTNNSSTTPEAVAARLCGMGIPATANDVCTSAQAAAEHIATQRRGAAVFAIGEEGLKTALAEAGLSLVEDHPDVVVQGIDRQLTYERISVAASFIRGGADYILTNPDELVPSTDGFIPGAGSISAMLTAASGTKPHIIGKPSPVLMDYALRQLGADASATWVIGDNMATDIAAGVAAGCGTILVLTGITNEGNYESYAEKAGCRPDMICQNMNELIAMISERLQPTS
ncbi:TIGR01457 family HAD-type hydrolase [Paenibacillus chungangensis]|uniref:Acid sugar phosphatase n=1 Tax=Paenibacillus chungangensis TaxID=696535 RepID=A0ABW3HN42_9BACL